MSPVKGAAAKKDAFTFLSFLQCNRHSKSGSNDSGISTTERQRNKQQNVNNGVVVISDDEDGDGIEFEMLCGVQFENTDALPMPIEQKLICKVEPENIQETLNFTEDILPEANQLPIAIKEELIDMTVVDQANLSECEEELLTLCKPEPYTDIGDAALKSNNYIIFICPQCGLSFDNNSTWKTHINSAHNLSDQRTFNFTQRPNNKFQCNKCQAIITRCTLKTLQQHRFLHLPYKVYKCKLCRHETRSLYLMISHIMLHKDKEELDMIETEGSPTAALKNSALEHESKQFIAYICPVCGVSFDSEDTWQAHINFRHNFLEKTAENRYDDHFKCSDCNVEIFSQHVGDLQQHLFTHLPYKSFLKCKLCNWTISRRNFMISHILNLHKTHLSSTAAATQPTADVADKMSISLPNVFNYDVIDDSSDSDSTSSATSTDHRMVKASTSMIIETRRSVYKKTGFRCVRCPQGFPTAAQRNAHVVAHHGKYVCQKCNENFAIKADMTRHKCEQTHRLPMQCNRCFKEYNYEKCYQNHMRRCAPTQHMRDDRINK